MFNMFKKMMVVSVLGLSIPSLAHAAPDKSSTQVYTLDHCIVSGQPLPAEPVRLVDHGREILFCDEKCVPTYEADSGAYRAKLEEAVIESQGEDYAATFCPVSGEPLGSMGEPMNVVVGNRLVKLCCDGCRDKLTENPDLYINALDELVVKALDENYPFTTCPVSGGKLGGMGEPATYVFAGQLVKFCCGGCIEAFEENPIGLMNDLAARESVDRDSSSPK